MPKVPEEKSQHKARAPDVAQPKAGKASKASLKGVGFAEGEAMRAPGGKDDDKSPKGKSPDDKTPPKAMAAQGVKAPAVGKNAASGSASHSGEGAVGDSSREAPAPYEEHHPTHTKVLENDGSWVLDLVDYGWIYKSTDEETAAFRALTPVELASILIYTKCTADLGINHFDYMNAILRGQVQDPELTAKYTPVCEAAIRGLKKMRDPSPETLRGQFGILRQPKAAAAPKKRNKLGKFVHNRTAEGKAEKRAARRAKNKPAPADNSQRSRVCRRVKLSEGFATVFGGFTVGKVYEEKAFFSTSSLRPMLSGNVNMHIWDPAGGKTIDAISLKQGEGEVLFPPGMRMEIQALDYSDKDGKGSVTNPKERFPSEDASSKDSYRSGTRAWTVEARMLPVSGTEAEEGEEDADAEGLDVGDVKVDPEDLKAQA